MAQKNSTCAPKAALDKSSFKQSVPNISVSVLPRQCHMVQCALKKFLIRGRNIRPIQTDPSDASRKVVLLDPSKFPQDNLVAVKGEGSAVQVMVPASIAKLVKTLAGPDSCNIQSLPLEYGYDQFSMEEVLRRLLPESIKILPSSFEAVGKLAHLNLRDELVPYKHIVGEVLLSKNVHVETVVYKTGNINSEFRTFPMEVIAGVDTTMVQLQEAGAKFQFDFRDVYWNSRLQTEHQRVTKRLRQQSTICDMFCGVGPFAVPASMKGCTVLANDLNPESVKYLKINTHLNKISPDRLQVFNMDARAFVRSLLQRNVRFDDVIMNLPADALEFLDVFKDGVCDTWVKMPRIFCYGFSCAEKAGMAEDIIQRAEKALGLSLDRRKTSVRDVRDVSPKKHYLCLEFELPRLSHERMGHQKSPKKRKISAIETTAAGTKNASSQIQKQALKQ